MKARSAPSSGLRKWAAQGPVHFMGVGGAGMAPLAELLMRSGAAVSGCDLGESRATERLQSKGMAFRCGHDPAHVAGAAAVVATSAVPPDHPELAAARAAAVPVIKRAVALAQWVAEGRTAAIAGTHGKTTTTAMAAHVLTQAGADPTAVVGGCVSNWDGNLRHGSSDLFVVEADEYDRSFLALRPTIAVITNVEADHLDVYGDLGGVRKSFAAFVERLEPNGVLWVCSDDHGAARAGVFGGDRARSYGLSAGSQLRAVDVECDADGSRFAVIEDGKPAGRFFVPMPGLHNVRNALAAIGVGRSLGVEWNDARAGLAGFQGVGRRYEVLGAGGGVTVVDDYAHHPTEVAATLTAVRRANPDKRVVAVFQPHLYSRTRDFCREFGDALGAADAVWVTDVYPAREEPLPGVDGEMIADAVRGTATRVAYHSDLATLARPVVDALSPGDVCVVMGAGSIEAAGPRILRLLQERAR